MQRLIMMADAVTHQMYGTARRVVGAEHAGDDDDGSSRDRGAVSLEQVLWFVAAGVSVAVIATILWNEIRDQANTDPVDPTAPTP